MTTEDAFLADIRDNPDDDAPRLIFADWLDDRGGPGDGDRAEFIRVQIASARAPRGGGDELAARARVLLERRWDAWTAPLWQALGSVVISSSPVLRFQRGFIDELTLDAGVFLAHARALFETAPVGRLRLLHAGGAGAALAACEPLGRLRELEFTDYYRNPLTGADMVALACSPHLGRLRALRLNRNNLGDAGAQALAGAAWLSGLMALDLTDNGLSADGVTALARTRRGFRPLWLGLALNEFGDAGAAALAESPLLEEVHWLDLAGCALGVGAVEALAGADLGGLRHLDLGRNGFTDACARRLSHAPWLGRLTRLTLRGNRLTHEGLAALAPHVAGAHLVLS